MTLAERLQADLTTAIRSRDALRRETLRMAVSAANYAAKAARRPLSDDEVLTVLVHEVKTRHESVEAFEGGGRPELAAKERAEIAVLEAYLPQPLSAAQLRALVARAIDESGATTPRDMGKVMAILAPQTRGRADGKAVAGLVTAALAPAGAREADPHEAGAHEAGAHESSG